MKEFERRYYAIKGNQDDAETATLIRNMQAENCDHWRVELNEDRWRTAAELLDYLNWIADELRNLKRIRVNP
jgi:hypothetical protein